MRKLVSAFPTYNQLLTERIPKVRVRLGFGSIHDNGERGDISAAADARELLERLLGRNRQAAELANHKVHYIVGVTLGANAI